MTASEQELKRILHIGQAIPFYQSGDRLKFDKYYVTASFAIENLIAQDKAADAANCIVKAFSDGYSPNQSMLVCALAVCAKQKTNEALREAAYKAIKTVCSSPENLFLFIKFACKFSENNSVWGNGFRKACKEWYLKKDLKTLAHIVAKHKKYNGRLHKDIIKLIHLKPDTAARAAIVKYVLFGIKAAKKEFGENAEANELLNYLQTVEDFRRLTDDQLAARNIEIHHFTLEHVPSHLLKSKEVWSALVRNLPLPVLLKNLERIGYLDYLKQNSALSSEVIDALKDESAIAESHLHPAQVFVALQSYKTSSKYVASEKAKERWRLVNRIREPKVLKSSPKPNQKIISALYDLFASTCKLFLAPTGLRYFVAIDLKSLKATDSCFQCRPVSPAQASVVTALCLLHADRNVSLYTANSAEELVPFDLVASMSVQQGVEKLEQANMQRMKVSTPIEWATKNKKESDIFILITDTNHKKVGGAVSALQKYREEMNIPNSKLIIVMLKCHFVPVFMDQLKDPGIFVIGGFDGNVPRLIEAFSRGAF